MFKSVTLYFFNNPETMSMKGLTLNSLDKEDQAYEWAKLGLKNNISSSVCRFIPKVYNMVSFSARDI
jgi:hypothetical protein